MENKVRNIFVVYNKNLNIVKNVVSNTFDISELDFSVKAIENVTSELIELKNDTLNNVKNNNLRKVLSNYNPYRLDSISYGNKNITLVTGYKSIEQLEEDLSKMINQITDLSLINEIKKVFEEYKLTSKFIIDEIRKMKNSELNQDLEKGLIKENLNYNNIDKSIAMSKININLLDNEKAELIDEDDIIDVEELNNKELLTNQNNMYLNIINIKEGNFLIDLEKELGSDLIEEKINLVQLNLEENNLLKLNYIKDELNCIIDFYEIKNDLSNVSIENYPTKEIIIDLYSLNIKKYNKYLEIENIIDLNNNLDYYKNMSEEIKIMINDSKNTIRKNKINEQNKVLIENNKNKAKTLLKAVV